MGSFIISSPYIMGLDNICPRGAMKRDKQFIVELSEDVATGELVTTVPEEILNELSWYEGTELEWIVEGQELILREYQP